MSQVYEPSNAELLTAIQGVQKTLDTLGKPASVGGSPALVMTGPVPQLLGDNPANKPYNAPPPPDPNVPKNSTDAWWMAQPPEVQALRHLQIGSGSERESRAYALASRGFSIDREIVVNGVNPAVAMSGRFATNSPWVLPLGANPPLVATFDRVMGDQFTYNGVPYHLAVPPTNAIWTTLTWAIPFHEADKEYGINWNLPAVK